jgi:CheY-like chemotaxis protein
MAQSLSWTLERLKAELITAVTTIEETKALVQSGQYHFLFAPESLDESVISLLKDSGSQIKPIFISSAGIHSHQSSGFATIPSPVYCISIANILNDNQAAGHLKKRAGKVSFTAPEAKILIVDDLEINLKVAKGLMMPFKLQVDICTSGQGAIEMIKRTPYDLIFMDHMMPGMDGLEATEEIRKLPEGQNIPIVALTANAVSGVKEMFLAHGMNDFISKPIEVTKLENLLAKWIPKEKRLAA